MKQCHNETTLVTLNFEESFLDRYIDLERRVKGLVSNLLVDQKDIDQRLLLKLSYYLSTLKLALGCKDKEAKASHSSNSSLQKAIRTRKIKLIQSIEYSLILLDELKGQEHLDA